MRANEVRPISARLWYLTGGYVGLRIARGASAVCMSSFGRRGQ